MLYIFVTLEVSQLRGWLKPVANCRGSQAGHTVRGGLRAGGGRRGGRYCVYSACRGEGCNCRYRGQGARGAAHVKHAVHVRDAGGVPAQGLVELVRVLPRVASRAHGAGRAAGREAGGGKRARLARSGQGRGLRLQISGAKRAGAQRTENIWRMSVSSVLGVARTITHSSTPCG